MMAFFWLKCFPPSQVSDTPPSFPLRMCREFSGSTHTTRWSTCVLPVPSQPVTAKVFPPSFETVSNTEETGDDPSFGRTDLEDDEPAEPTEELVRRLSQEPPTTLIFVCLFTNDGAGRSLDLWELPRRLREAGARAPV